MSQKTAPPPEGILDLQLEQHPTLAGLLRALAEAAVQVREGEAALARVLEEKLSLGEELIEAGQSPDEVVKQLAALERRRERAEAAHIVARARVVGAAKGAAAARYALLDGEVKPALARLYRSRLVALRDAGAVFLARLADVDECRQAAARLLGAQADAVVSEVVGLQLRPPVTAAIARLDAALASRNGGRA